MAPPSATLELTEFRRLPAEMCEKGEFFGARNLIGLSDVLTGLHSLKAAAQRPRAHMEFLVRMSDKLPPGQSELLGSEGTRVVLGEPGHWAGWSIMDTLPLLAVTAAAAVTCCADGDFLMTKGGSSTREAVNMTGQVVVSTDGHLLGSAVRGLDTVCRRGGYGYVCDAGSGYGGSYSYDDRYNAPDAEDEAPSPKRRVAAASDIVNIAAQTPPRAAAEVIGKILRVVFTVAAVFAVAALAGYFLDQAVGRGIVVGVGVSR